ncbi:hypothetical protein AB6A40_000852 [Gnathostoma spinigerum]|uniref:Uncharacterized protein n=1 Tax=Gnathostoma spinigerum TaxID=75299 RepID=A0ABD6EBI5_9BILA
MPVSTGFAKRFRWKTMGTIDHLFVEDDEVRRRWK